MNNIYEENMLKQKIKYFVILIILTSLIINSKLVSATPTITPQANINQNQNIAKLDNFIKRFEKGFLKFAYVMGTIFKKYERVLNPKTVKALKTPLRLFIHNLQGNKHKNYLKYVIYRKQKNLPVPQYYFKNNQHFYYNILPVRYRKIAMAGFDMKSRIMYINPSYNPLSIFDNLVVFHEMVHAYQDTILRDHLSSLGDQGKKALKKYISLLKQNIKDPDLEPVAYAMELELLNMIFKNKIRKIIKSGKMVPIASIAKFIKANTNSKFGALKYVLKYGIYYFGHDCWIYSYTKLYRAIILKDHMKLMGQKFYKSENRFIKRRQRSRSGQQTVPNRIPGSRINNNQRSNTNNNSGQENNASPQSIDIN